MNVTLLDRKGVRLGIKNGFAMVDFAEKYECTEKEIRARIEVLYPKVTEADDTIKEILSNKRKSSKRRKKDPIPQESPVKETLPEEQPVSEFDALLPVEEKLSSELMELEAIRVSIIGERRGFAEEIRRQQKAIKKILAKCEELVEEANQKGTELNQVSVQIFEKTKELDGVRARIKELSTVTLCVYEDGRIAPYDERVIDLNDEGFEDLFLNLTQEEECANLRVNEVKTLARLLKMVQNASSLAIEVICDNLELEKVYKTLIA